MSSPVLKAPILYFGGKSFLATKIVAQFPNHHTYVEPFFGSGSVFFAKHPSPVEVLNDLDGGVVGFYRVLRDEDQFSRFLRLASLTPYSRQEYSDCLKSWSDYSDPVERAWAWFVVARMSFSGIFGGGWGSVIRESKRGMAKPASALLGVIERLPDIHDRLIQAQIENRDFRRILTRYDTPDTLNFLDPPYAAATRSSRGGYTFEMEDQDHREMVEILLGLKGMSVLCGYKSPLYSPLTDAGWARIDFSRNCTVTLRAPKRTGKDLVLADDTATHRTESLWISPSAVESQTQMKGAA